jgi:very-short-patch-repair endonuclease
MDAKRDAELIRRGWRILRIPNADVDESPEKVARKILRWAKTA